MRLGAILLVGSMLMALVLMALPVRASNGELEWEAVPRPNTVTVRYIEGANPATGLLYQILLFQVVNGPPNTTFDLVIKDRRLATLQTDPFGEVSFEMQLVDVVPGNDGRPPVNRRIDTGDTCSLVAEGRALLSQFIQINPEN